MNEKKYLIADLNTGTNSLGARACTVDTVDEVLSEMFDGMLDPDLPEGREVIDAIESIGVGIRRDNWQIVGAAAAWLGVSVTVAP